MTEPVELNFDNYRDIMHTKFNRYKIKAYNEGKTFEITKNVFGNLQIGELYVRTFNHIEERWTCVSQVPEKNKTILKSLSSSGVERIIIVDANSCYFSDELPTISCLN